MNRIMERTGEHWREGASKRSAGRARTGNRRGHCAKVALGLAVVLALVPSIAFASEGENTTAANAHATDGVASAQPADEADASQARVNQADASQAHARQIAGGLFTYVNSMVQLAVDEHGSNAPIVNPSEKLLEYDRSKIDAIGTQASTGHTICCPGFSCAYADAVLDGTVHSHEYYGCCTCVWTDWGGGNSWNRSAGSDEALLREAYDQISAGRPTVIHVAASYGEHWIALIGYTGATDPDHLTLGNFIALDPWDASQVNAGDSFSLYGDGCEHISDR